MHRAAQGDRKARTQGLTGTGRHGGVSEKVVEVVEVSRYWPGKAPKWTKTEDADDEGFLGGAEPTGGDAEGVDRRLRRLAEGREAGAGRRRHEEAEVLEEGGDADGRSAEVLEEGVAHDRLRVASDDERDEDEDAIEARRERLLAMRRARREQELREEEAAAQAEEDGGEEDEGEEDEEGESEYEYETESDDGHAPRVMLKPVFVANSERETIKQREALEAEQEEMKAQREQRLQERQAESRQMLVDIVRKEETGDEEKVLEFADMPDDDDDADEIEQFELWKVRELRRLKREIEERQQAEKERKELERRRNLSDAERRREDEEFAKQRADYGKQKEKWKFLQKYYHKGAYFQDEDETGNAKLGPVMMQDFGTATGKDAIGDKSAMPKPMQVKNFGMRSQVKWTHLTAEDTSSKDALWSADSGLRKKYQGQMAGVKAANDFSRPSHKRHKSSAH